MANNRRFQCVVWPDKHCLGGGRDPNPPLGRGCYTPVGQFPGREMAPNSCAGKLLIHRAQDGDVDVVRDRHRQRPTAARRRDIHKATKVVRRTSIVRTLCAVTSCRSNATSSVHTPEDASPTPQPLVGQADRKLPRPTEGNFVGSQTRHPPCCRQTTCC